MKDVQLELESARTLREEVAASHKELEKKYKAQEEELLRTQQDLLASERARKDLQVEKEEIAEEIQTASRLNTKHINYRVTTCLENLEMSRKCQGKILS